MAVQTLPQNSQKAQTFFVAQIKTLREYSKLDCFDFFLENIRATFENCIDSSFKYVLSNAMN